MEGVNLIPFLNGKRADAPHDALFWRFMGRWSILSSNGYKHIHNPRSPKPELFYLKEDIGEQNDVVNQHPELAQQMLAQWQAWDVSNVAMRNPVYGDYYRARENLFIDTIPEAAVKEGYKPEFKRLYPAKSR